MQHVDSWATQDKRVLVYFTPEVMRIFVQHRQRYPRQPEAGGILLGRRRGRHFEVTFATTPSANDKQWTTGFVRERQGHQEAATRSWAASSGEIDYVGEWHTHPQRVPSPSGIDLHEWQLLASKRSRNRPLIATVVGTTSLYVALLAKTQVIQLVAAH